MLDRISRRPVASRHPRGNIIAGCLIVLGIIFVALIIGAYLLISNAKNIAVELGHAGLVEVIKESEMTNSDKDEIILELDAMKLDIKEGKISMEQIGKVMEQIGESPLIPVAAVTFAEKQYIRPSGLSDDEKSNAELHLDRFARGVYEETIPQEAINEATAPLKEADPHNPGEERFKERVSDAELKTFIANVRQHADDAGISEEHFEINIAEEFRGVLERALGYIPSESRGMTAPSTSAEPETEAESTGDPATPESATPDAPANASPEAEAEAAPAK